MASGTILVIDDDSAFRALLRATLEAEGLTVIEGGDGSRAVGLAMESAPDVVLLDWRMPGDSGITACRRLREEPELSDLRIAMLTGLDDERDRTLARKAGADAFLVKDADIMSLTGQVLSLLTVGPART
jgi:DNA-binding response OmpR family regulator